MYLILGILIGAIITAGCFLLFTKSSKSDFPRGGERPDMSEIKNIEDGNFVRGERFKENKEDSNTTSINENTTIE